MLKNYCKKCNKEARPRPAHANERNDTNSPPTALPSPNQTSHHTVADDFAPTIDEQHWILIPGPTQDQQPTHTAEPTYVILSPPSTPQTSEHVQRAPTNRYHADSYTTHPTYSSVAPSPVPERFHSGYAVLEQRWPPRTSRGQTSLEEAFARQRRGYDYRLQYGRPVNPATSAPHGQRGGREGMSTTVPSTVPTYTSRDVPSRQPHLTTRDHETFASDNDGRFSRLDHYSRPAQSSMEHPLMETAELARRLARLRMRRASSEELVAKGIRRLASTPVTAPKVVQATQPARQEVGREEQSRSAYEFDAADMNNDTVEYGSSESSEEGVKTSRMEMRRE